MTKVTFLLAKDPVTEHGGDIELSRVVMRLAAEAFDVSAICYTPEPAGHSTTEVVAGGLPLTRVAQDPVSAPRLFAGAVRHRRSLVHVRFDTDALLAAIEDTEADVFSAEHSYMAETFLRSAHAGTATFAINTMNTESQVWRATRGALGMVEAPRLLRDELRVARGADAVGCYEIEEAQMYREHGVAGARFMEITMPPKQRVEVSSSGRRLVFMGVRDWPPNQEAFLVALRLWPRISAGIADAELCVIGRRKPGAKDPLYPQGVRDLGFVDDLAAFLGTCRALIAPIKTGGGVRVKLLDAASLGLPVVGTGAAVGSLGELFGMAHHDDEEQFVEECRRMLLDREYAATQGRELHRVNADHWRDEGPHRAVTGLLTADRPR